MLYLHHSNQLEQLAEHFAALQCNSPLAPFQKEYVVVQNSGMGRWLSLQVAQQNGIVANVRYLFPAEMTWELLRSVLPLDVVPEKDPCAPATLRWRLLAIFLQAGDHAAQEWPDLQSYLATGAEGAWQLAGQLAKVYDQYLFFRPRWIAAWETADTVQDDWQARLWWQVAGQRQLPHWVRLQQRFVAALAEATPALRAQLLPRITFFSVPVLSPGYIRLLSQVAQYMDIHVYLLNPSQEYWGDIESEKRKLKKRADEQDLVDIGNPLLASWGRQGRDFLDLLLENNAELDDLFSESAPATLLQQIQHDILTLQMPQILPELAASDRSLVFHLCHSPMREAEVLYDQLLALFAANPDLTPADVVVMTPDIDTYAPYLSAVFGTAAHPLPFSIADSSPRFGQGLLNLCQQLLELPQTRCESETVLGLLEFAEVRAHLGLDEAQVLQCREWIRAVNIRWGVDADSRQQQGGAATFEHTWRYGLDRWLLGYALPGEQLFADVLPFNEIEGSLADVLGHLQQWLEALFACMTGAEQTLPFAEWDSRLRALLQAVVGEQSALQVVWQALDALAKTLQLAEFNEALPWRIFKTALAEQLDKRSESEGFLGRGITCCALMPMRTVPFRFVALIGMNDGVFPRRDHRASFDRMAQQVYRGDRLKRDEDRYLFLESVLSARQWLYISYVGLSAQDNNPLPPSVLVSELQDYVERLLPNHLPDLLTVHPLQAFSRQYLTQSNGLFTYSQYLDAQMQTVQTPLHQPFWDACTLPELDATEKRLTLESFVRFFQQPARTFLQKRFGLRLHETSADISEREPFALESYRDSDVRDSIFQQLTYHEPIEQSLPLLRAQGWLPHGELGELLFTEQAAVAQQFYTKQQATQTLARRREPVHLPIGDFQLNGVLKGITDQGRVVQALDKLNYWQWLSIWLEHLVLNALPDVNCPRQTLVYGLEVKSSQDKTLVPVLHTLQPVADALEQLTQLLTWYWQGLHAPLLFFPKSAFEAVKYDKKTQALVFDAKQAQSTWDGETYQRREADKPEYRLLYRGVNPLEQEADTVREIALAIFGGLLNAKTE